MPARPGHIRRLPAYKILFTVLWEELMIVLRYSILPTILILIMAKANPSYNELLGISLDIITFILITHYEDSRTLNVIRPLWTIYVKLMVAFLLLHFLPQLHQLVIDFAESELADEQSWSWFGLRRRTSERSILNRYFSDQILQLGYRFLATVINFAISLLDFRLCFLICLSIVYTISACLIWIFSRRPEDYGV